MKKIFIFLLIVALVGGVGYLIVQNNAEFESKSPETPTSTVESFYETWTNYEGEDILEGTYRDSELITESLIEDIEAAKGFDPVLCAQDIPGHFEVELISQSTSSSVVQVREFFGGNESAHEVKLLKKGGKWLLNEIDCQPGANKGGFLEAGNLVKDLPGLEEEGWFLSYEKPGQPGLTVKLNFNEDSRCSFKDTEGKCQELLDDDKVGTRVEVGGKKEGEQVAVEWLTEKQ